MLLAFLVCSCNRLPPIQDEKFGTAARKLQKMFRRWRWFRGVLVIRRRDKCAKIHADIWELKRWIVVPTKPHRCGLMEAACNRRQSP